MVVLNASEELDDPYYVSAIVVTYYTGDELVYCIENLLLCDDVKEIILVNNGNPDGFMDSIRKNFSSDRIYIIEGHGNVGFAKACNIGSNLANNDYLLFINPDCYLITNQNRKDLGYVDLRDMIYKMESDPLALMSSCVVRNKDGSPQRGCYRKFITPKTTIFGFNMHHKIPKEHKEVYIDAISGSFMLIKKYNFNNIGKFDESYFLHFEDMDLCMKVKNAGGKILFFPQYSVTHMLSTSKVSKFFVEQHKMNSCIYYFRKFFGYGFLTNLVLNLIKIRFWIKFGLKNYKF